MKKINLLFIVLSCVLFFLFLYKYEAYGQSCTANGGYCWVGASCCSTRCSNYTCVTPTPIPTNTPTPLPTNSPTPTPVRWTCGDYGCSCRGSCRAAETYRADGSCSFGQRCCCPAGAGPSNTPTPSPAVTNYTSSVNFGLRVSADLSPWIQTTGGDLRIEGWGEGIGGYNYNVPEGTFASVVGSGGYPGIIFTGNSSYSFCSGGVCQERASAKQWVSGGSVYPEVYEANGSNLKTSYNFISSKVSQAGMTPAVITELTIGLENGVYKISGDLNTPEIGYGFKDNMNYLFLITGDLNVNGNIKVPVGSTATFVVKGDINVSKEVGVTPCTSTVSNIEGFFSTDQNFIMETTDDCDTERRLNIAGNIVINAGLAGGAFQNDRNLCESNTTCPVLSVSERPDFILNAPEVIKHTNYIWQEAAP
jgi:hypothetical protein